MHMSQSLNLSQGYNVTPVIIEQRITNKYYDEMSYEECPLYEDYQEMLSQIVLSQPLRNTRIPECRISLNIYKLFLAVDAYMDQANPIMTPEFIVRGCFSGPGFAKLLKRIKYKSISFNGRVRDKESWYDSTPIYQFTCISQIFNYRYLINWKEPEEDFFPFYMIPVSQREKTLVDFKYAIYTVLQGIKNVQEIYLEEILLHNSSSTTYDGKPFYISQQYSNEISHRIGDVRQCQIQPNPQEIRQCVILKPSSLWRVMWIEQQLQLIIQQSKYSGFSKDSSQVAGRLRRLNGKSTYLMRDFEKEGMTKPRNLLRIMLEVLYDVYKLDAFAETDFYETFSIEGQSVSRGHGLGMANALTTLMQLGIIQLSQEKYYRRHGKQLPIDFLVLNDDHIGGTDEDQMTIEEYWEIDSNICEFLSLIVKKTKCFESEFTGVFCEEYFPLVKNDKESYLRNTALQAMGLFNIVQAKEYVQSICTGNEYINCYINEIISKYGFEFSPFEHSWPPIFGGWINQSICGYKLDIYNLKSITVPQLKAYYACKEDVKIQTRRKGEYIPPYRHFTSVPIEEDYKIYFQDFDIKRVSKMFKRVKNPQRYWNKLYKQRQKCFQGQVTLLNVEEFIQVVQQGNEKYVLPEWCYEKHVRSHVHYDQNIYQQHNPKVNYLQAQGAKVGHGIPEKYSIWKTRVCQEALQLSESRREQFQLAISLFDDQISQIAPMYPEDYLEALECYDDINGYYNAYNSVFLKFDYPILMKQYRPKMLIEKKRVFGRFLTKQEVDKYKDMDPRLIKCMVDKFDPDEIYTQFSSIHSLSLKEELSVTTPSEHSYDEEQFQIMIHEYDDFREAPEEFDMLADCNFQRKPKRGIELEYIEEEEVKEFDPTSHYLQFDLPTEPVNNLYNNHTKKVYDYLTSTKFFLLPQQIQSGIETLITLAEQGINSEDFYNQYQVIDSQYSYNSIFDLEDGFKEILNLLDYPNDFWQLAGHQAHEGSYAFDDFDDMFG